MGDGCARDAGDPHSLSGFLALRLVPRVRDSRSNIDYPFRKPLSISMLE